MKVSEWTDEMKSIVALVGAWAAMAASSLVITDLVLNGYTEEKRLKAKEIFERILSETEKMIR